MVKAVWERVAVCSDIVKNTSVHCGGNTEFDRSSRWYEWLPLWFLKLNVVTPVTSDARVLLSSSSGHQIALMCVQGRLCNELKCVDALCLHSRIPAN
jgi:hypothetical protein